MGGKEFNPKEIEAKSFRRITGNSRIFRPTTTGCLLLPLPLPFVLVSAGADAGAGVGTGVGVGAPAGASARLVLLSSCVFGSGRQRREKCRA